MYKHQYTIPLTQLKWQMTQQTILWILLWQMTILTMSAWEHNFDLMLNILDEQDKLKQDVLTLGNAFIEGVQDIWTFNTSQD